MSSDHEPLEVQKYLSSLHRYFTGDIDVFRKLSSQIEMEEIIENGMPDFNVGSMYHPGLFNEYHNNLDIFGNESHFRLTIPVTLSIFSVIDLLGFLVGNHPDPGKTHDNFKAFFSFSQSEMKEEDVNVLNYIYRQGLAHVYFPKLNLGVKFHSTNPDGKLFFKGGEVVFLNVNYLIELVLVEFERVSNSISGLNTLQSRYDLLVRKYESDRTHIDKLII